MIARTLVALLVAAIEMGQAAPMLPHDPHVQSAIYVPGLVFTLPVATGYATLVELAEDDRIETIVLGNSAVWQVTADKRGDQFAVKPLSGAVPTDLIVTTGSRRYVFLLQPGEGAADAPFVLRFDYPQTTTGSAVVTGAAASYKFHGDKRLLPVAMTDDGQRTSITWGTDTPLPAVFAVDDHGAEALVNGRMVAGSYVIERVSPRFVFRRDKARAEAVRRPVRTDR